MNIEIRKIASESAKLAAELEKRCFSEPWSEKAILEEAERGYFVVVKLGDLAILTEMYLFHTGMEAVKCSVSTDICIYLYHIGAVSKCGVICSDRIAGNVSSADSTVGGNNYALLRFFIQIHWHRSISSDNIIQWYYII